jgi:MoaA/NifB/PqqE/SkfB family radical SAM enzyme
MMRQKITPEFRKRIRAWRNMATSATMRRVDPSWLPLPHAGHFIVTFKCNLKCKGCGSWKVKDHDDLTAQEWRTVFRQLKSLDLVKILGGEPFVRKDIVEILQAVREEVDPYILQLTTNGMLTNRLIEAIHAIAWPGLQLRISVDGLPKTHDTMRGVDGSWEMVDRSVREVGKLRKRYGFKFGINFAVTDDSVDELPRMLEYANSVGADLIPGLNVDPFLVGTTPPEQKKSKVIMVTDKERALEALVNARAGTRTQLPLIDHVYSRLVTKRTFRKQLYEGSHRFTCRELRDLIYVKPNGEIVRCGLDHKTVGNLRTTAFEDIWFGNDIEAFRKKVDDCPGCLQASVQILSRLYGGCILG